MAKKEKGQEVNLIDSPAIELASDDEVLEAEAYGVPKLDQGADVTVSKPVGYGGPVPIVAPKHTTIQLQPIVVPLAVVPYMTSDSNVLRTDSNKTAGQYTQGGEEEIAPTFDTKVEKQKKAKSKRRIGARVFAFINILFFGFFFVPFILSYFNPMVGSLDISEFNIIGQIYAWVEKGFAFDLIPLLYILVAALSGIEIVISFIGLIIGKYPKITAGLYSFIEMASLLGILIYWLVLKMFNLQNEIAFIVLLSISIATFIVSIVAAGVVSHLEDTEEIAKKVKEI